MTDPRPLWLLDVDGPINLEHGRPGWQGKPRRSRVIGHDGRDFPLRWAPSLIVAIRKLHRSGLVEIKWATSWIGTTDLLAPTLGLPDFESAYPDPGTTDQDTHRELKRRAFVHAYAVDLRPVIWTDDDAIPPGWVEHAPTDTLIVVPKPNRGLQPEHLDAIEAFIRQHAPEGAPA